MSDYTNPPNPFREEYFRAWNEYTEAYHSGLDLDTRARLYEAYEIAKENLDNNPQTIFN